MDREQTDRILPVPIPESVVIQAVQDVARDWLKAQENLFEDHFVHEKQLITNRIRSLEEEVDLWRRQIADRRDAVDKKIDYLEDRIEKRAGKIVPVGLVVLAVLALGLWGVFEARLQGLQGKVAEAEGKLLEFQRRSTDVNTGLTNLETQRAQFQERINALNALGGQMPNVVDLSAKLDNVCLRLKEVEKKSGVRPKTSLCP